MIEKKFRSWDIKLKKFAYLILEDANFKFITPTLNSGDNHQYSSFNLSSWEQFIGLLDKHGVEIYENDLVEYTNHYADNKSIILTIKWDEKNCCYRGMYSSTEGHVLNNFDSKYIKKIGNIYENPELLK